MERPLLSICIPTYNRADIVYECVCNQLQYDADFFDVVVTDNCSPDDTQEKLAQIHDPRFKYFRNRSNIGHLNQNVALRNGDGKYCLLLSDEDDLVDIDWDTLKRALLQDEIVWYCFDSNEEQLRKGYKGYTIHSEKQKLYFKGNTYKAFDFVAHHSSYCGGMIFRRDTIETVWDRVDKAHSRPPRFGVAEALSLYIAVCGDCAYLNCIRYRETRTVQLSTEKLTTDDEWYAWIEGRRIQNIEQIDRYYSDLPTDDILKYRLLMREVYLKSFFQILSIYDGFHNESSLKKPDFINNQATVDKYLSYPFSYWLNCIPENARVLKPHLKAQTGRLRVPFWWRLYYTMYAAASRSYVYLQLWLHHWKYAKADRT